MSRYEYDVRRGMRRNDDDKSATLRVTLVVLLILGMFGIIIWFAIKQVNDAATAHPTSIAKVRTDDGGTIRVYSVQVDGTEYLLSERGGICPKEVTP